MADLWLTSQMALDEGLRLLEQCEPDGFRAMIALGGRPTLRARPPGFEGLASIIVAQQVSSASAAAIFGRLSRALQPMTPETLSAASDDVLRQCGLSNNKLRTLRATAAAILAGQLPLDRLGALGVDEAHRVLTAVKGIGPWTADVFLLFCLGHPDAFPSGDLALQEAARLVLGGERRPSATELIVQAERWRPHRGVAAYLLWACYRAARGRSGMILATA